MKLRTVLLISLASLSLSACQTFQGMKQDLSGFGSAIGKTTSSAKTKIHDITAPKPETEVALANAKPKEIQKAAVVINDGSCPPITVDPQLNSVSEFYDMKNPSTTSEVSHLKLTDTASECKIDGEYLDVRIQLSFTGALGPKAKRKDNDRPFFAYPYFVAVTDSSEEELAKELFAASVTYDKNQESISLVETIRQKLPLNADGSNPGYRIKIGFQLSEDQLFYNASL